MALRYSKSICFHQSDRRNEVFIEREPTMVIYFCIGFIIGFYGVLHFCSLPPHTVNNLPPQQTDQTFLYVGVITSEKYLSTRAQALYDTWGSRIPGRLEFFLNTQIKHHSALPIVNLPGKYNATNLSHVI